MSTPVTIGRPIAVVVMGVSGSGKTTVARLVAEALDCQFLEGDELHSPESIAKMRSGHPLTTEDRLPWLRRIAARIGQWLEDGQSGVLTCSALKRAYRDILVGGRKDVALVYLRGSYDLIAERLAARHGHFMPAALLKSQFKDLEEPAQDEGAIIVDIDAQPQAIADKIVQMLANSTTALDARHPYA